MPSTNNNRSGTRPPVLQSTSRKEVWETTTYSRLGFYIPGPESEIWVSLVAESARTYWSFETANDQMTLLEQSTSVLPLSLILMDQLWKRRIPNEQYGTARTPSVRVA